MKYFLASLFLLLPLLLHSLSIEEYKKIRNDLFTDAQNSFFHYNSNPYDDILNLFHEPLDSTYSELPYPSFLSYFDNSKKSSFMTLYKMKNGQILSDYLSSVHEFMFKSENISSSDVGALSLNSATYPNVTEIYFNAVDASSENISLFMSNLNINTQIEIKELEEFSKTKRDTLNRVVFLVKDRPQLVKGLYILPVSYLGSWGKIVNGERVRIVVNSGESFRFINRDKNSHQSVLNSKFAVDMRLEYENQIFPSDYNIPDYNKGHLVPFFDGGENVNVTTNMAHQLIQVNESVWNEIELIVRKVSREKPNDIVYTLTGTYFDSTQLTPSEKENNIPSHFYKIVVVDDGSCLTSFAFLVPNVKNYWMSKVISLDDIVPLLSKKERQALKLKLSEKFMKEVKWNSILKNLNRREKSKLDKILARYGTNKDKFQKLEDLTIEETLNELPQSNRNIINELFIEPFQREGISWISLDSCLTIEERQAFLATYSVELSPKVSWEESWKKLPPASKRLENYIEPLSVLEEKLSHPFIKNGEKEYTREDHHKLILPYINKSYPEGLPIKNATRFCRQKAE